MRPCSRGTGGSSRTAVRPPPGESSSRTAPPFDEGDEYARDVPVARLGDALVRHDRYDNGAVLERMAESKDPARFAAPLAAFLEERFRFSKWEILVTASFGSPPSASRI